ncbi:MAG: cytochrome c [Flavipsychrobacter sp.]|nr:cytochrome c [Flavipsychrobacter sp.]
MRYLFFLVLVLTSLATNAQPAKAALQQSITRGKIVYNQVCISCHQADGGGVPNMNPPLIKSKWVDGDKKVLINILLNGFSEKVAIDGDYYSNNMPAQSQLTDQQIADVLTYIRNSFENKASAILPQNVKTCRKK